MRRGTPNSPTIDDLVERTGLSFDQVKAGVELMTSGATDVLDAVVAGRMTVLEALAAVRRRKVG
jgi:hypothetical protein